MKEEVLVGEAEALVLAAAVHSHLETDVAVDGEGRAIDTSIPAHTIY